jgi:hypothetical protein
MKMKYLSSILAILVLLLPLCTFSQEKEGKSGVITFLNPEHDFGEITEQGGPVEHEFRFVNSGDADLSITTVRASCGCTTPGWSREAVAPGDTGFVKAQYNPFNRPGPFNKTLTVASTAANGTISLRIKGNVKPRPRTPADDFPYKIGGVRFPSATVNMGRVFSNRAVERTITIYNDSEDTIRFNENYVVPEHITLQFQPREIAPHGKSFIKFRFDPMVRNDLGYSNEQIVLFSDELTDSSKKLSVVATTQEFFPPMTSEERENAPRLRIDPLDYDFGTIKQGEKISIDFILVNEGKKDLKIRKTDATCPCTQVSLDKNSIDPGESTTMRVVFDSSDRKAYQYKTISVFSNDPTQPTRVLTIKGKVSE